MRNNSYYWDTDWFNEIKTALTEDSYATYDIEFSNKDMVWMVDGYDFCNDLEELDNTHAFETISLLRADGTLLQLRNEAPKVRSGRYFEVGANSTGYAYIKEDGAHNSLTDAALYPGDAIGTDGYADRVRVLYYYPGDGYEYVFQEYITPYGKKYFNQGHSDEAYSLGEEGALEDPIGYGRQSSGASAGTPKVFYLVRINHQNRELIRLRYEWHYSNPTEPELADNPNTSEHEVRFNDGAIGRAGISYFNHHYFNWKYNKYTIRAFNKEYIIDCGKDNFNSPEGDPFHVYFPNVTFYGLYYPRQSSNLEKSAGTFYNSGWKQDADVKTSSNADNKWYVPLYSLHSINDFGSYNRADNTQSLTMTPDTAAFDDAYDHQEIIIAPYEYFFTALYYPSKITQKVWTYEYEDNAAVNDNSEPVEERNTYFTYEDYSVRTPLGTMNQPSAINFPGRACGTEINAVLDKAKDDYFDGNISKASLNVYYTNTDKRIIKIDEPTKIYNFDYHKKNEPYSIPDIINPDQSAGYTLETVSSYFTNNWMVATNAVANFSIVDRTTLQPVRITDYNIENYMQTSHTVYKTDKIPYWNLSAGAVSYSTMDEVKTTTQYDYFAYDLTLASSTTPTSTYRTVALRPNYKKVEYNKYLDIDRVNFVPTTIETSYTYSLLDPASSSSSITYWKDDITSITTTIDGNEVDHREYVNTYNDNILFEYTDMQSRFAVKDQTVETIYDNAGQILKKNVTKYQSLIPEFSDVSFDDTYDYIGYSRPLSQESWVFENKIYDERTYFQYFMDATFSYIPPLGWTPPDIDWDAISIGDGSNNNPFSKIKENDETLNTKRPKNFDYESCFWSEQKWLQWDTTKRVALYPIINIPYRSETLDASGQLIIGQEQTINTSELINFEGKDILSYSRGKPVATYRLVNNNGTIVKEKTDSILYAFGYQGGGLPFKHINANGAISANYYLYNHKNQTTLSSTGGTNPQFAVEDFWNPEIADFDSSPCGCEPDLFFTPAGILPTNSNTFVFDKIVETRNLTTRGAPVATRYFVRKYAPLDLPDEDDEYDGIISIDTPEEVKLNGKNDIQSFELDDSGNLLLSEKDLVGDDKIAFSLNTINEYSPTGIKLSTIEPNFFLSNFTYDNSDRLSRINLPYDFANPFSDETSTCYSGNYLKMSANSTVISTTRNFSYLYYVDGNTWYLDFSDNGLTDNCSYYAGSGYIGFEKNSTTNIPLKEVVDSDGNTYNKAPDLITGTIISDLEKELSDEAKAVVTVDILSLESNNGIENTDLQESELFVEFSLPPGYNTINSINDIWIQFKDFQIYKNIVSTNADQLPGTFFLSINLFDVVGSVYVAVSGVEPIIAKVEANDIVRDYTEDINSHSQESTLDLKGLLFSSAFSTELMNLLNTQGRAFLSFRIISCDENGVVFYGTSSNISVSLDGDFEVSNSYDLDFVRSNFTMCDYTLRNIYSPIFFGYKNTAYNTLTKIDDQYKNFFASSSTTGLDSRYSETVTQLLYDYKPFKVRQLDASGNTTTTTYALPSLQKTPFETVEIANDFHSGKEINTKNVFNSDGSLLGNISSFGSTTTVTEEYINASNISSIRTTYSFLSNTAYDFIFDNFYTSTVRKVTTTNNNSIKSEKYFNILGQLIVEIQDAGDASSHLNKTSLFNYDDMGNILGILNLNNNSDYSDDQDILYSYDTRGRVSAKYQPDLGIQSFIYDSVGNVRFSQTQEQHDSSRISFFEYDDLNRITLIGEVELEKESIENDPNFGKTITDHSVDNHQLIYSYARMIDALDPYIINDGGFTDANLVTANRTLWYENRDHGIDFPIAPDEIVEFDQGMPWILNGIKKFYDKDEEAILPLIIHKAPKHDLRYQWGNTNPSNIKLHTVFENVIWYPDLIRTVLNYDELPESHGMIWKEFPEKSVWDNISKKTNDWVILSDKTMGTTIKSEVRNLKGRQAAIAYRESGALPFNYMVFSYDARGRLEALMRYTDNLGYDAVYYYYNSADQITCQITADPIRHQVTWNEYDNLGNLISVVSTPPLDYGLCKDIDGNYDSSNPSFDNLIDDSKLPTATDKYYQYFKNLKDNYTNPDAEYTYYDNGLIQNIYYYDDNNEQYTTIKSYDEHKRLVTAENKNPNEDILFAENIVYDTNDENLGFINEYTVDNRTIAYSYDNLGQLTASTDDMGGLLQQYNYTYDNMGNRLVSTQNSWLGGTVLTSTTKRSTIDFGKNTVSNVETVPNPLLPVEYKSVQDYNSSGLLKHKRSFKSGIMLPFSKVVGKDNTSVYEYDTKGLLHRYAYKEQVVHSSSEIDFDCLMDINDEERIEWRYAYNPMGDREQKRVFHTPNGDDNWNFYPWTYNLLGASGNALAVYHGAQISDSVVYCELWVGDAHYDGYADINITRPYKRNYYDLDTNMNIVMLYPAEFNATPGISYRPDFDSENGFRTTWKKHLMFADRMGSTRYVVSADDIEKFHYEPFGKQLPISGDQRTAYIGMELDRESELGDHGVRKVDYGLGRFTTIDPLWEKYYAWSPYQYSMNNPVSFLDWNGKDFGFVVHPDQAAGMGHTTLYYQNGQGDWFRFDMGNYNDQPSSGAWTTLFGFNYNATVKINPTNVPRDMIRFQTTVNQDEEIEKSALESQRRHNSGEDSYNVYSNNCTDAAVDVILDAKNSATDIDIINPWYTIKPNSWKEDLLEAIQDGVQTTDFRMFDPNTAKEDTQSSSDENED